MREHGHLGRGLSFDKVSFIVGSNIFSSRVEWVSPLPVMSEVPFTRDHIEPQDALLEEELAPDVSLGNLGVEVFVVVALHNVLRRQISGQGNGCAYLDEEEDPAQLSSCERSTERDDANGAGDSKAQEDRVVELEEGPDPVDVGAT